MCIRDRVNLCLSIQAFQECVHSQSYSYMLDTICSPVERNDILYQWKTDEHLPVSYTHLAVHGGVDDEHALGLRGIALSLIHISFTMSAARPLRSSPAKAARHKEDSMTELKKKPLFNPEGDPCLLYTSFPTPRSTAVPVLML